MRPNTGRQTGRHRRVLLKVYGNAQVNTGHTPPRVDDVFAYRARARAVDDNLAKLLGLDVYTENEPRRLALARIREWSSMMDDCTDLSKLNHVLMDYGRLLKLFLFWNRSIKTFFFVEIRFSTPPRIRRSLGIHSREFAFSLHETGRISWYEWEDYKPTQ
jgi:hypothetical protein